VRDVRPGADSEVESHSWRARSTPMNGHRQTKPTGPFRAQTRTWARCEFRAKTAERGLSIQPLMIGIEWSATLALICGNKS
jgi:hypothetical protein